jgi:prepilin-type N-terminal cleavage/methylation domain-containing protein
MLIVMLIDLKNKQQNGYTIVELIVSIVVASILLLAINSILTTHLYMSQRSRDLVLTNSFAESKIESLRSIGYLGLSDGTTDITSELPAELSSPRNGSQVISSYATDIKLVTVTIIYNEQGGSRTQTYQTYIGELGVGQY